MRYAFGLVGVLVAIGALVLLMSSELTYTHHVVKEGNKAREQAEQIAGVGAADSVELGTVNKGGRLEALQIKALGTGGPIEKYYGVQVGDQVVSIGPMSVRDWGDPEMAKAQFLETYQRSGQIIVVRNGQRLTLPQAGVSAAAIPVVTPGAPAATPANPPANAPAQPANAAGEQPKQQSPDALLKSLNIPTH